MSKIESVTTTDVRFPTSLELDGSDAVNVDPDYSAAYVEISTDDGESGYGFVFTCGRGNEIVTAAMDSYGELLVGRDTDELVYNLGDSSRRLIHDSQMRWLGPEKGVSHMACGALVNALWDIRARREKKPLWLLLSEMDTDEIISTATPASAARCRSTWMKISGLFRRRSVSGCTMPRFLDISVTNCCAT